MDVLKIVINEDHCTKDFYESNMLVYSIVAGVTTAINIFRLITIVQVIILLGPVYAQEKQTQPRGVDPENQLVLFSFFEYCGEQRRVALPGGLAATTISFNEKHSMLSKVLFFKVLIKHQSLKQFSSHNGNFFSYKRHGY